MQAVRESRTIAVFASGGSTPYSYSVDTGASYDTASVFVGLGPATYIVVVQDASGCSVTGDTIVLSNPPGLNLGTSTVENVLTCAGDSTGSITVSATGGTGALEYSLDTTTWQSSGTFDSLPAGIYVALVRDSKTCMASFPADTVGEPLPVTAIITTTTAMIPDSGSLTISASGGTASLEYSIDSGKTFTSTTFYRLVSEIYYVVVQDENLCSYEEAVYVSATPPLNVDVFWSDVACFSNNDGAITLTHQNGIGKVDYSIESGMNAQDSGSFANLAGRMYYIHVTDSYRVYRDTIEILSPP
ncbi:SprB repeat-containing protein, partial [Bacteroidota bacterium]